VSSNCNGDNVVPSSSKLEETVHKTITLYNRIKSPRAIAKLISVSAEFDTNSFSSSFCYNYEVPINYVKDFVSDFKIFTSKTELEIGKNTTDKPKKF
jgi:hypothetical protein